MKSIPAAVKGFVKSLARPSRRSTASSARCASRADQQELPGVAVLLNPELDGRPRPAEMADTREICELPDDIAGGVRRLSSDPPGGSAQISPLDNATTSEATIPVESLRQGNGHDFAGVAPGFASEQRPPRYELSPRYEAYRLAEAKTVAEPIETGNFLPQRTSCDTTSQILSSAPSARGYALLSTYGNYEQRHPAFPSPLSVSPIESCPGELHAPSVSPVEDHSIITRPVQFHAFSSHSSNRTTVGALEFGLSSSPPKQIQYSVFPLAPGQATYRHGLLSHTPTEGIRGGRNIGSPLGIHQRDRFDEVGLGSSSPVAISCSQHQEYLVEMFLAIARNDHLDLPHEAVGLMPGIHQGSDAAVIAGFESVRSIMEGNDASQPDNISGRLYLGLTLAMLFHGSSFVQHAGAFVSEARYLEQTAGQGTSAVGLPGVVEQIWTPLSRNSAHLSAEQPPLHAAASTKTLPTAVVPVLVEDPSTTCCLSSVEVYSLLAHGPFDYVGGRCQPSIARLIRYCNQFGLGSWDCPSLRIVLQFVLGMYS